MSTLRSIMILRRAIFNCQATRRSVFAPPDQQVRLGLDPVAIDEEAAFDLHRLAVPERGAV